MIIQTNISCRGFVICIGSMEDGDVLAHPNSGDGVFTQAVYLYKGSSIASSGGKSDIPLPTGQITDLSAFAGLPISYLGGPQGALWAAINPTPATKRYEMQLLRGGNFMDVESGGNECVVVCLSGVISVGDKPIAQHKYARILPNKTAGVIVPHDSLALVMKAV